jgi:dihydroneopterin aldolase
MKYKMKVDINRLTFNAIIGILPFERIKKQKLIINLSFKYIYCDSKNFIDYSEVVKLVKRIIKKNRFKLIEDAIIALESKLHKKYKLKSLKIKIIKPNILTNCFVGVEN